jgi:hypothetical protein
MGQAVGLYGRSGPVPDFATMISLPGWEAA